MRVLQLIDSLDAGGAERMAVNIANTLSGAINHSYLCATRQEGLLKASIYKDVSYLFLNKRQRIDLSAIIQLRRFIKNEQIDIIHAHSTSFFMATLMKWLHPRLKIVWHDHYGNSSFLEQRKYDALRFCSDYFSLILTVNSVLETWAVNHMNCKQVVYLPNFVVQDTTNDKVTVLKGVQAKRVLCLANLRPQKDHHNLLKAFQLVHEQHPEWTLHCVGQDFKDAYADSVYHLMAQLDLEEHVFFYGSCADTNHIIQQADIGVLTSISEGLPLTLLEYGLSKLAVVATDVGDCRSVFPKACQVYVVAPNQPQALAEQLLILMADAELRKHTGHLIYKHVSSKFSAVAFKDKLIRLYSQL